MKSKVRLKKAFTIIEISIVLLIIGIIIAAVMSGGDVIRNAESKQFYQNFARKWSTVIDSYYDRMGQQICDSIQHEGLNTELTPDGYFDGILLEGAKGIAVKTQIESSGINIDKVVSVGQGVKSQYVVNSDLVGSKLVTIYLGAYKLNDTPYNFLILQGVPRDIATAVDRYVDGTSNGKIGAAIAIQTSADDVSLPANLSELESTSLLLDYNEITTDTTNIGIMVEH